MPPLTASIMQSLNSFYDSVLEIFWNEVLRVIKTVNNHATDLIGQSRAVTADIIIIIIHYSFIYVWASAYKRPPH